MASSQKRLVADPSIGLMDIQKVISSQFDQKNDYDLFGAVECPGHCQWSWKTAPNVSWMCKTSSLVAGFLKIAPNGVLASQKIRNALIKMTQNRKVNRSRFADSDWADKIDLRLRVVLSQFRELKKRPEAYAAAMRKASVEEKDAIDYCLSLMSLESAVESDHSNLVSKKEEGMSMELVPYRGGQSSGSQQKQPLETSTGNSIFQRILAKRDSSPLPPPLPPQFPMQHEPESEHKATKQKGLYRSGFCVPADESSATEPPTPMVRKRKKKQSPAKEKSQDVSRQSKMNTKSFKATGSGLDDDDLDIMEEALTTEVSRTQISRPRRSKKKLGKKPAGKEQVSSSASAKQRKKPEEQEQEGQRKSSFRHRKTSSAYHHARKIAIGEGYSPGSAKKFGRAAAAKISGEIEAGILQED